MNSRLLRTGVALPLALVLALLAHSPAHAQTQLHKLLASGGFKGEQFGISCDLSGDRVIVGSDLDGAMFGSGTAFVFDANRGEVQHWLVPNPKHQFMMFGHSVAIDGNRAVVGAYGYTYPLLHGGAAYLYDMTTGALAHLIIPADNEAGDYFGYSVSIDGDFVVIGAIGDADQGPWSGSAYVFSAVTGQELFKLLPSDGHADDNFGCSVAVSGHRAVVGAHYDDENGWTSGSAYVFDVTTGQELFKLSPAGGAEGEQFGWSVALDGNLALIGAHLDDGQGTDSGAGYLFDVGSGAELRKLLPDVGAPQEHFGHSVAIGGGLAVVGAPGNTTMGTLAGCGYVFNLLTGEQEGQAFAGDGVRNHLGWSAGADEYRAVFGAPGQSLFKGAAYLFEVVPVGFGYCHGDLGSGTPCPCANDNDGSVRGSGCGNGAFASGAHLSGSGQPRVHSDTLVLTTTGMDPDNWGLYFQADNRIAGGAGILFGDGLRCAGGGLIRLEIRPSDGAGTSSTTLSIAEKGEVSVGETKRYQCWYRDNSGNQPCGQGVNDFNLSNGYEITWRL